MTGIQLKTSIQRLLNIDLKNAGENDKKKLLSVLNTSKDEIAEIIHANVNENYFSITEVVQVENLNGTDTVKMAPLPVRSFGSIYSVTAINESTQVERKVTELTEKPLNRDAMAEAAYVFELGRILLYGLDDQETMVILEYDRYPVNITMVELNNKDEDLATSINLPRPAHTALLRKFIYEMIRATDSAYRSEVIGVARQDSNEAIERMIVTLKRRNQSRNIIPPPPPPLIRD